MEEIKKLKMMLEGKMPMSAMETAASLTNNSPGEIIYQDRIIYRDGDNK
jgi:hypothetical protein